jgi:peptide/nickel transport system substrate-binding protein
MVEWKKDDHLTLERDPHYYVRGLPRVERLVYRAIADENARTTALQTGEVDIELDVPPRDVAELRRDPALSVESVPGTFWEYIGLNTRRPPFDDARVRQAIAWAVDRNLLDRLVKLGRATVLDGGNIPPSHWAYAGLHVYPHRDLARARRLLRQAGHAGGFSTTLKVGSSFPYQVNAAQVIKQQLRDVGIRVHIVMQESGLFFDSLGRHDFDMDVVGWVGFVDPDEWTYNLFHSGGKYNQQGYSNPALDKLLELGRKLGDRQRRKQIYTKIQRIVAADAPMVFLYDNSQISATRRRVKGFFVHPTASTIFLRDVSLGSAR